jgi:hypothetical protein
LRQGNFTLELSLQEAVVSGGLQGGREGGREGEREGGIDTWVHAM